MSYVQDSRSGCRHTSSSWTLTETLAGYTLFIVHGLAGNENLMTGGRSSSITSLPDCVSDQAINRYSKHSLAVHDSVSGASQSSSLKSKLDFDENTSSEKSDFHSQNCLRTIDSHAQTSNSLPLLDSDDEKKEAYVDRYSANTETSSVDRRMLPPLDKAGSLEGSTETEDELSNRADAKDQRKKKKKRKGLTADCSNTRYDVGRLIISLFNNNNNNNKNNLIIIIII